ncbi:DUF4345 domain-containing protein [Roseomonas sp. USHLN139]|uniref:DUF4345 domain-containing protein n=1 Tax=Roseomonas sp. USHLN139 TaxID=3081298 RepID=UPI003B024228
MTASQHRRWLRAAVALAGLVPVSAGLAGLVLGTAMLPENAAPQPVNLDSHYRYLSGLLLGIGLAFWWSLPRIHQHGARFRLLGFIVFLGGIARLFGLVIDGNPGAGMLFGLAMELGVTPLLCLWQWKVSQISQEELL